jgi:hypothetical protein
MLVMAAVVSLLMSFVVPPACRYMRLVRGSTQIWKLGGVIVVHEHFSGRMTARFPGETENLGIGDKIVEVHFIPGQTSGVLKDVDLEKVVGVLAAFDEPVWLRVSSPSITDRGLNFLSGSNVQALELYGADISDEGLQHLVASEQLCIVILGKCPRISEGGLQSLERQRPDIQVFADIRRADDGSD